MTHTQFTFAVLLLLCTPGPTNTLVALGGYSRGWLRALPLSVGEIAGYLLVILPVATVAAPFFAAHPQASLAARLAASAWVLYLGVRLWMSGRTAEDQRHDVSVRQVFVTTVLNPKALIIALVIMPHGSIEVLLPRLLLFAGLVLLAANGWIVLGRLMRSARGFEIGPAAIRRTASVCLLLFAVILAKSSIQSLA